MAQATKTAEWTCDFAPIEREVAHAERGALDVWIKAATVFAVESVHCKAVTGKGLSLRAFADAWMAQFRTRSAQTVRQNIMLVQWAQNNGYDLESFVSLGHLIEVKDAAAGCAPKKTVARVTVTFGKDGVSASKMTAAQRRAIKAWAATL